LGWVGLFTGALENIPNEESIINVEYHLFNVSIQIDACKDDQVHKNTTYGFRVQLI